MVKGLPHIFAAGQISEGTAPFDAVFTPAPERVDLIPADIVLDVIGAKPKVFDAVGLDWVTDVIERLPGFGAAARKEVTDAFLEQYNDGWRDPDDPVMTSEDFGTALGVPKVQLMWTPSEGAKSVEIWFSNVPMYLGHALFCIYRDDETMTVIDCGMFG